MKSFKLHISLILPLVFMMFAFEFILIVNATVRHYESLLNKDYNIIIMSNEELKEDVLKTKIANISSLQNLKPDEIIEKFKNDISPKNLNTLKQILPQFYTLKLKQFLNNEELKSLEKELLNIPSIVKVESFAKTHSQTYTLLVLMKMIFWVFLFIIFFLSFILFLKQMKIWLFTHKERIEIMSLLGAPFSFRAFGLFKLVFVDCFVSFCFLLLFFTQIFSLNFIQKKLEAVDISLPNINFFFDLTMVFGVVLLVCFTCVNFVMSRVKQ